MTPAEAKRFKREMRKVLNPRDATYWEALKEVIQIWNEAEIKMVASRNPPTPDQLRRPVERDFKFRVG